MPRRSWGPPACCVTGSTQNERWGRAAGPGQKLQRVTQGLWPLAPGIGQCARWVPGARRPERVPPCSVAPGRSGFVESRHVWLILSGDAEQFHLGDEDVQLVAGVEGGLLQPVVVGMGVRRWRDVLQQPQGLDRAFPLPSTLTLSSQPLTSVRALGTFGGAVVPP